MSFLVLLLTISLKLTPTAFAFHLCLSLLHSDPFSLSQAALTETMSRKFQGSSQSRFGGSEKYHCFLKIPKWQHNLVQDYKGRKLVSYFLNDTAKTCLYELKFPENIDIDHVFQYKAFLRLSSKLPQRLLNVTLPQVSLFFFKHVASKNQLTGFYIGGTLA